MLNNVSDEATEACRRAADIGGDVLEEEYETVQEYAHRGLDYVGDVTHQVSEFVRRAPWSAVISAFAIGYVAARFFRRAR